MKNRDNREPDQMTNSELVAEMKLIREKKSSLSVRKRFAVAEACHARNLTTARARGEPTLGV